LRVSEACGLAFSQVDIARRVLHVHRLQEGLSTTHPLRGDAISQLSVPCIGRGQPSTWFPLHICGVKPTVSEESQFSQQVCGVEAKYTLHTCEPPH
jgi:hypothetical protein